MTNDTISLQTDERRQKILEMIDKEGKVKVADLSRIFAVSDVSIRMDLNELESQGVIQRIHGGAIRVHEKYFDRTFKNTLKAHVKEKQKIAEKVASTISDNDMLFINSGSTGVYVLKALSEHSNLTIVTNSIPIAQEASYNKNMNVFLIGGKLDPVLQSTSGESVITRIDDFYADKAILSIGGIDGEIGITTRYYQEAEIARAMIKHAKRTIVLGDHSKVGNISLVKIESLESIHTFITDEQALESYINRIRNSGVEVYIV